MCSSSLLVPSLLPREKVNKSGGAEVSTVCGALNLVTKMAVYRSIGAAIATILVDIMQDDDCE